ncbi:hypothetical protein CVT25_005005 [Psilocybe cyanescens]|uniref:F-box domain-containing protein n=1 Tax=Psilocybe cyanescens TaxID=93625 RepID=A0A409XIV9_PSICY|nr:hypothetical protein CVT25_005005 [Psilocybe cyanescens]
METSRRTRSSIDAELGQLEAQLKNLVQRETDFQKVIDYTQQMKDALTVERKATEKQRAELEAQKEPINWLPVEMLIQVFSTFADLDFENVNYRPSVIVSHVCTKWRGIALSTSHLWRRIVLEGFNRRSPAQVYLERSAQAPLELDYTTLPHTSTTEECYQVVKLVELCWPHFIRVETLSIQCKAPIALVHFIPSIKDHVNKFPQLRHLVIAITAQNPSFIEAPTLLDVERPTHANDFSQGVFVPSNSCLYRLKLEQFPLFNFPASLIANLVSLELVYSPRRLYSTNSHYYLKMSSLCRFLALTPHLEELILANTVPYFDVYLPSEIPEDGTGQNMIEMLPVTLFHLKTIDWTFPYSGDIHRLLSMINAPGLERLDLWVEDPPKRIDTDYVRGYTHTSSPYTYTRGIVNYPSLRDLSLQCAGEDTTVVSLRKFAFPGLEKVAFTNIDTAARRPGGYMPALPVFPRLESIFRDPRLPNLTHLTLSHFQISTESGRVEALLGYIPMLTSLSLDACPGAVKLLDGLHEQLIGTSNKIQHTRRRGLRGVKVCPRLEALSFWGCQDVDFATLLAVVNSRNRNTNGFAEETVHKVESATSNGAIQHLVTRGLRDENGGAGHRTETAQMGRKIKPLRKLRRDASELSGASSLVGAVATASTATAMHEAFRPANIIYLRVTNCKLINEEEALRFKGLGVVDVIWAGSD